MPMLGNLLNREPSANGVQCYSHVLNVSKARADGRMSTKNSDVFGKARAEPAGCLGGSDSQPSLPSGICCTYKRTENSSERRTF